MSQKLYRQARYLSSASKISQLPQDSKLEVAFAGRSNAGKSSTLNALCDHKNLARVSKTPGRTQMINIFEITDQKRLADLPGYGYAKASINAQHSWAKTVHSYLETREVLAGIVLIVDIRRQLEELDWQLITWCASSNLAIHIVLNKADKLKKGNAKQALMTTKKDLEEHGISASLQIFSATAKSGLEDLCEVLDEWYQFH